MDDRFASLLPLDELPLDRLSRKLPLDDVPDDRIPSPVPVVGAKVDLFAKSGPSSSGHQDVAQGLMKLGERAEKISRLEDDEVSNAGNCSREKMGSSLIQKLEHVRMLY